MGSSGLALTDANVPGAVRRRLWLAAGQHHQSGDLRRDAAVSFLCDLLPARSEAVWEVAVAGAVDAVCRGSRSKVGL